MVFVLLIATVSACVSVLSAMTADSFLKERISILGSFLGLQYSLNPGVAFGIRFPPFIQELLIGAALLVLLWFVVRTMPRANSYPSDRVIRAGKLQATSYGLILGGGIANIIDRLPDGVVTDYFQIGTFP
ncbi:MAG: signal peptidase II, partial [Candidatus Peribacteraceae bacterium]|nr:signal peptidase II [Candidatus Peribacteraceae bacterium]